MLIFWLIMLMIPFAIVCVYESNHRGFVKSQLDKVRKIIGGLSA